MAVDGNGSGEEVPLRHPFGSRFRIERELTTFTKAAVLGSVRKKTDDGPFKSRVRDHRRAVGSDGEFDIGFLAGDAEWRDRPAFRAEPWIETSNSRVS